MQKFKESAFSTFRDITSQSCPSEIRYLPPGIDQNSKKSYFMLDNIFSGPKLYSPMYFPGFQANQRIHMFNFSRNNCSNPPW